MDNICDQTCDDCGVYIDDCECRCDFDTYPDDVWQPVLGEPVNTNQGPCLFVRYGENWRAGGAVVVLDKGRGALTYVEYVKRVCHV